jgi:hypothetical protein
MPNHHRFSRDKYPLQYIELQQVTRPILLCDISCHRTVEIRVHSLAHLLKGESVFQRLLTEPEIQMPDKCQIIQASSKVGPMQQYQAVSLCRNGFYFTFDSDDNIISKASFFLRQSHHP